MIIALRTAEPKLDNRIDANSFALFCTPVINLFPKRLDPILISDRFAEFHIVPERMRPIDFEVFQIQQVVGVLAKINEEQRFEPFYLARDNDGPVGRLLYGQSRTQGIDGKRKEIWRRLILCRQRSFHFAGRCEGCALQAAN